MFKSNKLAVLAALLSLLMLVSMLAVVPAFAEDATTAEETFTEVSDGEMPPIPGGETERSTDETQEWVLQGDPIPDGEIEMGEFPEDTAIETDEEAADTTAETETETDPVVTDLMGEPAL